MKKCFLLGLILLSFFANAQITRIDHFFASSPKAEKLFKLFKEELKLPVAWEYQNWGSFASGGISLGNVAFEFVSYDSIITTKFDGIALEPRRSVEEFILILDANHISHDTIEANTYKKKDGSIGGWSNLNLPDLLPKEVGFFVCDYKQREEVRAANRKDSIELIRRKGGALGIVLLKEIIITSNDFMNSTIKLSKLPGISSNSSGLFSFSNGTSLRLKESTTSGIEKIVILVNSLIKTKEYLKSSGLLGMALNGEVFINSAAIEGLAIQFVDK
jgi:hypothetical protein